ncbi:recombinase family protein [Bacillus mexicanus]|uniref:recombinase family protein n=1 Tax=Bacillus mexicanus TaxID=2834415 RepID=UPI003D1E139C
MIVGYSRISDKTQKNHTQVDQLKKFGCDKIVEEIITGVAPVKELNKLIEELSEGDTLVVTRADRIARRTSQILTIAERLKEKDVNLVILDLGIDSRTPTGKMVLTIMGAVSEWEREQIKVRQKQGIKSARERGVHLGRKGEFSKDGLALALEMYDKGDKTVAEICAATKVSKATLYRKLKERKSS